MNSALKMHDRCLLAKETHPGRIDIYRVASMNDAPPYFVFSLTEDWKPSGKPVPWSVDIVLNRIKAHDLWRDDTFVERWIAEQEKAAESEDRARRNDTEAFLYDFARQFQRATNDINTSTLEKIPLKGY